MRPATRLIRTLLACALATIAATPITAGDDRPVAFTAEEREAILAHGPWPPPFVPDPSNRVSGIPAASALGQRLFADRRLSRDGDRACTTCHEPARAFTDGRDRSQGAARLDRNAISLADVRLNRWFGWDGAADTLWSQSLRPILDERELGASAGEVQRRLGADVPLAASYKALFATDIGTDPADLVLVNLAKALAAYQERIVTGRTAFDDFRDALARNGVRDDHAAAAAYPIAAQRGLKIFVGKGRCSLCHLGPAFTSGEFDSIGVRHFAGPGRVDTGRHGGIALLQASPYSLLGAYTDDRAATTASKTRYVEQTPRTWGEFRVPSLRNVTATAPYMHDGSLATLADVIRHYSEVDIERLHGEEGARIVRPLRLTPGEAADLVAFLQSLSAPILAGR